MSMLDVYKTNDMLLPDATFEEIKQDLVARNAWHNYDSNGWTFYGEPDVFPQFAMHEDSRNTVDYFE